MCKSPLHDLLVALPKCEHHMHLEGSLSPELLFELAEKNDIQLPQDDSAFASVQSLYERYDRFASLDDFLHYYYIGFTVLITSSDFEALANAYFVRAHAARVRHAEVFFDPQLHLSRGVALTTILSGFGAAQARAASAYGQTTRLIPCLLRHLPVGSSETTFAALVGGGHFARGELAGVGLCSSELELPPARWAGIFAEAKALGVRRTVHAGEEGPASYVAAALDDLAAERIDHGVKAAGDPAVVDRLAREGVLLSLCPLSNLRLRGVARLEDLPVRLFLDRRVRFSINSDDPAYFGGYILENYCAVQDAHALSVDEWETIVRDAVEGSWCDAARKAEIMREIDDVLASWRSKGC